MGMPYSDYQQLLVEMQATDNPFYIAKNGLLYSNHTCADLTLNPIGIQLGQYLFEVQPSVYMQDWLIHGQDACVLMIEPIPDSEGIYILGNTFVSAFKVAFSSVEIAENPGHYDNFIYFQNSSATYGTITEYNTAVYASGSLNGVLIGLSVFVVFAVAGATTAFLVVAKRKLEQQEVAGYEEI